jgi:nitronate monooxygenase
MAAPMTDVSGPALVAAACAAGVIGAFPAHNAADSGVDGVVLLAAGAGGQTGWANPFAFLRAVRQSYDGIVVIAGGISDGAGILAAQVLGADLAYLGTRFIATTESLASPAYRDAVVAATLDDVTTSVQVTGLPANVLTGWLRAVGAEAPGAAPGGPLGPGPNGPNGPNGFAVDRLLAHRGVWAAGHSVSGTDAVTGVAGLVDRLERELEQARYQLLTADVPALGCA